MADRPHNPRRWLFVGGLEALATIAIASVFYIHSFLERVEYARRPGWFTDDVRIGIWPFFRYSEPSAWTGDYLGDYALAIKPSLFRGLYTVAGYLDAADALSRGLPILFQVGCAVVAALVARQLAGSGGPAASVFTATTIFGSSYVFERLAGGLARSFAFPVIAVGLYALVSGRVVLLAVTVVLASGLYPPVGVVLGLTLAGWLLLTGPDNRGSAGQWSAARRWAVVAVTAAASLAVVFPTMSAVSAYGAPIGEASFGQFPEALRGLSRGDRPPWSSFGPLLFSSIHRVIEVKTPWWSTPREVLGELVFLDATIAFVVAMSMVRARHDGRMRRVGLFVVAALLAHMVGRVLHPAFYVPTRSIHYPLTFCFLVLLAVAAADAGRLLVARWGGPRLGLAAAAVCCGVSFSVVSGRGVGHAGYAVQLSDAELEPYRAVARLPAASTVAGWPDDTMSNVPYLARRRCLMTGEMMLPFHEGYVHEIRRRLEDVFRAYLAHDPAPLRVLRDRYSVTHMLVERRHYTTPNVGYIPPVGRLLPSIVRDAREAGGYLLPRHFESAAVYADQRVVLLDLERILADTSSVAGR